MKVAVLSLTRDRLEYSMHCFGMLHQLAGCDYDHHVLDQGSQDDTPRWLLNGTFTSTHLLKENVGISKGMNMLLDHIQNMGYDVIVKLDNDCELVTPDTLKDVCAATLESGWILSPVIKGIGTQLIDRGESQIQGHTIAMKQQIPGCFMAVRADWFAGFRYSENNPSWGMDDAQICAMARMQGRRVGYVIGYEANHFETTEGQEARYPEYFRQKVAEGLPWE